MQLLQKTCMHRRMTCDLKFTSHAGHLSSFRYRAACLAASDDSPPDNELSDFLFCSSSFFLIDSDSSANRFRAWASLSYASDLSLSNVCSSTRRSSCFVNFSLNPALC